MSIVVGIVVSSAATLPALSALSALLLSLLLLWLRLLLPRCLIRRPKSVDRAAAAAAFAAIQYTSPAAKHLATHTTTTTPAAEATITTTTADRQAVAGDGSAVALSPLLLVFLLLLLHPPVWPQMDFLRALNAQPPSRCCAASQLHWQPMWARQEAIKLYSILSRALHAVRLSSARLSSSNG